MKKLILEKSILAILILCLASSVSSGSTAVHASAQAGYPEDVSRNKIEPDLKESLQNLQQSDMVTVVVTLRQRADLSQINGSNRIKRQQNLIRALKTTADATQGPLKTFLQTRVNQGRVHKFTPLWITNGFSVTATSDVIDELALNPNVQSITSDTLDIVPAYSAPEINVSNVNAPVLWEMGYTGQGIVIAALDTGVDLNHPDLFNSWRGGTNSWFDPYGQHPTTPIDLSGHGTWTMGVMVGGGAGGTTIGIAPGAQWIAAKIFDDSGFSSATAIHLAFQWLLDPDGNPSTDDAPHVVNNSWTMSGAGCNLNFETDLQVLRAAGILPVFAAGNYGPFGSTSRSPANNPSAFPVGNINDSNGIYGSSSRGPSSCAGWTGPYPRIVAPGVTIHTSDLFGGYYDPTGTSLSAPHVAGGLALLLSAFPNLSAVDQENALINSAVDLGVSGPDNSYGYGRLDLLAALNLLASGIPSTATATATSVISETPTSTPFPTLTPTWTSTPTSIPVFTSTNTQTPFPTLTNTSTALPSATSTSTLVPTATWTSTPLPTKTSTSLPTATFTSLPSQDETILISSPSNGTVAGIAFADEDILAYTGTTNAWSRYFDGSDVGITGDVDAFSLLSDGSILMSLDAPVTLSGLGTVDDSDIIRFTPTSLGENTSGSFSSYLVGSTVGLTTNAEDVDSISFTQDGRLVVSTLGTFSVPGISGNDEDLIVRNGSNWSLYFDGSDVGLNDTTAEQISGSWIDPAMNYLYLSSSGNFNVTGLSGTGGDIYTCIPGSLGANTTCNFSLYWSGLTHAFGSQLIDGFDVRRN